MFCKVQYHSDNPPTGLKLPSKGQGQGQKCKKMVYTGIFLPVFCYFSKSLVQNCLNICFESLRYVVYETKVKKIWH